ncbi:MAG: type IV secretion system DNA-binding domain-containing protein [Alphaproteobacteria bacterium]
MSGLVVWLAVALLWAWLSTPSHSLGAFTRYKAGQAIEWASPKLAARLGWHVPTGAGPLRLTFAAMLDDPWHQAHAARFGLSLLFGMVAATVTVAVAGAAALHLLCDVGRQARESELIRGPLLVDDREVVRLVAERGCASDLKIGGVPLIAGSETENILLVGSVGTGKTEVVQHLLDVIQVRGEPAIVYDTKGQLFSRYRDGARGDVLLNPLDRRSAPWSPWAEIAKSTHPKALAESLIPASSKNEPFWHEAARVLFRETLIQQMDDPERSVGRFVDTILTTTREELHAILAGTPAARYLEEGVEKMGASVRGNVDTYIDSLTHLRPDAGGAGDFSIRRFVERSALKTAGHAHPWLWLTSQSDDHEAIRPLLTCWIDVAVSALLSLPLDRGRRVWFILDEIASLQRLPKFIPLLERGREHGGCVVLGLQDVAQLDSIYGHQDARVALTQLSTKVIFRLDSQESSRWASDIIGHAEISETQESARYDPGDDQGAVHFSSQSRVKPLVLPSEIAALDKLHGFVKLPGGYPVARTRLPDPAGHPRPSRQPAFEPTARWRRPSKPVTSPCPDPINKKTSPGFAGDDGRQRDLDLDDRGQGPQSRPIRPAPTFRL